MIKSVKLQVTLTTGKRPQKWYLSRASSCESEVDAASQSTVLSSTQVESFRRPAFAELLDDLGEVGESLEPPTKSEETPSWFRPPCLKSRCTHPRAGRRVSRGVFGLWPGQEAGLRPLKASVASTSPPYCTPAPTHTATTAEPVFLQAVRPARRVVFRGSRRSDGLSRVLCFDICCSHDS